MEKFSFKKCSVRDKLFYVVVGFILTIFFLIVLYPCLYVLSSSLSSGTAVQSGKVLLFPVDFTLDGYSMVFSTPAIWTGFKNSLFYTIAGTCISIILTMTAAYGLARKDVPGSGFIMLLFTFTMFFNGGMIPLYLLVSNLGWINTRWAIIMPGAINVYNLIVARTFIKNTIPDELLDASQIDGCGDIRFFISIVLPLSKAAVAVQILFYSVTMWNSYFEAMIYLHDKALFPLTLFLRDILIVDQIDLGTIKNPEMQVKIAQISGVIKYALIVVTMIPVLVIYPFIQKYFVKGVMIGSVKG